MTQPIKISILGATGSIGKATLDLVRAFPDKLEALGLAAKSSLEVLAEQIREFKPKVVSVGDQAARKKLLDLLDWPQSLAIKRPEILVGAEGLDLVASQSGAQTVISAVVGAAGLRPTYAALVKGLKVCLANKESLVLAGEILTQVAGDRLAPVDSEHSAIFQALGGRLDCLDLDRLILTASGGPFRGRSFDDLKKVTREQALNHPTWSMGPKVTCDSATMMNKGLEVIEAHHLFNLDYDQIEVLVHPLSYVHSLAGFKDGSILAQMGPTDMKLAIAYALSHPARWPLAQAALKQPSFEKFLNQAVPSPLTFEQVDRKVFRPLALAEMAGRLGGTAPATLNAANEVAVEAFLAGRLAFIEIFEVLERTLEALPVQKITNLDEALAADQRARIKAAAFLPK
ncbi:MAG: 1-deoxy-D-xylulose-5-phosphate reductoisomerase [Deltaproteobacteria bacterium]|jgi:1-deoxy-D-xylulose-5-phosphate reductoisomerase|nr:1-deoxy-D-xylulose-5-phosphate reductoisomerase [Deltaproteobacteria bacterium]